MVEIINGMEEVLILLFTAFGCEYVKCRRTRLKSEVIYSGKDLIRFQKTYDKKEEKVKPKKSSGKNVSTNTFLRFETIYFSILSCLSKYNPIPPTASTNK